MAVSVLRGSHIVSLSRKGKTTRSRWNAHPLSVCAATDAVPRASSPKNGKKCVTRLFAVPYFRSGGTGSQLLLVSGVHCENFAQNWRKNSKIIWPGHWTFPIGHTLHLYKKKYIFWYYLVIFNLEKKTLQPKDKIKIQGLAVNSETKNRQKLWEKLFNWFKIIPTLKNHYYFEQLNKHV